MDTLPKGHLIAVMRFLVFRGGSGGGVGCVWGSCDGFGSRGLSGVKQAAVLVSNSYLARRKPYRLETVRRGRHTGGH
jgi:hypothetical protein